MSDNTPTPVDFPRDSYHRSDTGAYTPISGVPIQGQLNEVSSGVNVMKLHMPLPAMAAVMVFSFGLVATVAVTWFKAESHASARDIHLDSVEVVKGGGVAFKQDVAQYEKKTRRLLKAMTITCAAVNPAGGMFCKVDLPEE